MYTYATNLTISEVYFAGTDERVELYNNDSMPFSGTITLSGVKSSLLTMPVYIAGNSTILLGDAFGFIPNRNSVYAS